MRTLQPYEAATLQTGDIVSLVYPSSQTGEPTPRKGRVEKVTPSLVVVETSQGVYRSFKFSRILGEITVE